MESHVASKKMGVACLHVRLVKNFRSAENAADGEASLQPVVARSAALEEKTEQNVQSVNTAVLWKEGKLVENLFSQFSNSTGFERSIRKRYKGRKSFCSHCRIGGQDNYVIRGELVDDDI